jgi:surface antigen
VRRLRLGLAGVLLTGVMSVLPSAAHAETTLCVGTDVKSTMKCDPGWAVNMMFMHWRMYRGHNCTNYVAWRLTRDGVPEPSYLLGNAVDWAGRAKSHGVPVDSTPEVGAVGAWSGRNHIVYVDQVGSDFLLLTEDSYSQKKFRRFIAYKGERSYPTKFIHFQGKNAIRGTTPTVSGEPEVGQTLKATVGTWSPSGVKLTYQWLRDGVVIKGATSKYYRLVRADAGHRISISVTGTYAGKLPRTTSSLQTDAVSAGTIKPGTAKITGTPIEGQTLTASSTGWTPSDIAVNYQWFADGDPIKDATSRTLKLTKKQRGEAIVVRVTAYGPGYKAVAIKSPPTAKVVKDGESVGAVTAGKPTITGSATYMVGEKLTAKPGTWSPDPVKTSVQWMRNGVAIKDATTWEYRLTKDDAGKTLRVDVVGTKTSYTTARASSASTPPIRERKLQAVTEPSISGDTVVGSTLTVQPGSWAPSGVKTYIVWTRDGKPTGKRGATHVVTEDDVRHTLGAVVTAQRDGFDNVTHKVELPRPIQAVPQFKTSWDKSTTKHAMVLKLSATALGKPIGGNVRITEDGRTKGLVKLWYGGPASWEFKGKEGQHSIRLTYEGADWLTNYTRAIGVTLP